MRKRLTKSGRSEERLCQLGWAIAGEQAARDSFLKKKRKRNRKKGRQNAKIGIVTRAEKREEGTVGNLVGRKSSIYPPT